MTPGVPREHWEAWLEQNRNSDLVRNGLVLAADAEDGARGQARERTALRSGLEPIVPSKIPERTGLGRQVERADRGALAEEM